MVNPFAFRGLLDRSFAVLGVLREVWIYFLKKLVIEFRAIEAVAQGNANTPVAISYSSNKAFAL